MLSSQTIIFAAALVLIAGPAAADGLKDSKFIDNGCAIEINGVCYNNIPQGADVSVSANKVKVDGKVINPNDKNICASASVQITINQPIKSVTTTNGDVKVAGSVGDVRTTNGAVSSAGKIIYAHTVNGNITGDAGSVP